MKKVYIAGKVGGLPFDDVVKKFAKAQTELENKGYSVLNPIEMLIEQNGKRREWDMPPLTEEGDRTEILRMDLVQLIMFCNGIYLLNDWHSSVGAVMEYHVAHNLGMEIMHEEGCPYNVVITTMPMEQLI